MTLDLDDLERRMDAYAPQREAGEPAWCDGWSLAEGRALLAELRRLRAAVGSVGGMQIEVEGKTVVLLPTASVPRSKRGWGMLPDDVHLSGAVFDGTAHVIGPAPAPSAAGEDGVDWGAVEKEMASVGYPCDYRVPFSVSAAPAPSATDIDRDMRLYGPRRTLFKYAKAAGLAADMLDSVLKEPMTAIERANYAAPSAAGERTHPMPDGPPMTATEAMVQQEFDRVAAAAEVKSGPLKTWYENALAPFMELPEWTIDGPRASKYGPFPEASR